MKLVIVILFILSMLGCSNRQPKERLFNPSSPSIEQVQKIAVLQRNSPEGLKNYLNFLATHNGFWPGYVNECYKGVEQTKLITSIGLIIRSDGSVAGVVMDKSSDPLSCIGVKLMESEYPTHDMGLFYVSIKFRY